MNKSNSRPLIYQFRGLIFQIVLLQLCEIFFQFVTRKNRDLKMIKWYNVSKSHQDYLVLLKKMPLYFISTKQE